MSKDFNPRSHKGSDFSAHSRKDIRGDFNPRSHKGSDVNFKHIICSHIFQSTLPQGERRSAESAWSAESAISIHAPTRGATTHSACFFLLYKISIHAPTRGATNRLLSHQRSPLISIHAPTRGATGFVLTKKYEYYISIHAPTRGATGFSSGAN